MKSKNELFSDLMRDLEVEIGSRDLTEMVMLSLIDAIKAFKRSKLNNFCEQYDEFVEMICNTEPKFGIFRYYFGRLKEDIFGGVCKRKMDDKWKKTAINKIKKVMREARKEKRRILEYSEKIKVDGKTILIHDHSHTVQDALVHLKKKGRKFDVIIAEQDYEKTHDNIERLHAAKIPFMVVPAYMLSHLHKEIDMVFFGALTLKDTMHFVMNPGALSIVTEFTMEDIPVYMFLGIEKFSLWKSEVRGEIFIHRHTREHLSKPIIYERTKYSHDRVPADLFYKVVTNEGILKPEKVEKLYWERFEDAK
ncbi:hypothetical protein ACFL3C_05430 [Patescibacteria group bacterium]